MAIINNSNINFIRDAFSHYYPDNPADFVDGSYQAGDFSWKNRNDFSEFVFNETKVAIKSEKDYSNIKAAQQAFEKRAASPEKAAEADMPEDLKTKVEQATKKEAERQKIIKESEAKVRSEIDRQQKNYEKLQASKQKVFVKAEEPAKPQLSDTAKEFVENVQQAPKEYIPVLTEEIEKSITPSLSKQLTKEQIHFISQDTAFKAVDAVNNPQKYIEMARQSAILAAAAKDETVLPKVLTGADSIGGVRTAAAEIGTYQNLQTITPRIIFSSFNHELAETLFPDPGNFKVSFSQTQAEGFTNSFDPADLTQGYINFLGNQSTFFAKIAGLPVDKFQSELVGKASSWIEGQVAANFPQSAAFFSSPESRLFLSGLGIGGPITIELPATMSTFFIENPAALPAFNFIGSSMGVNFSIGSATTAVAAETAAVAGGEAIAAAGAVGVEAAAGAAAGTAAGTVGGAAAGAAVGQVAVPIPVIGAAIGAIVGPKVVKLVKDNAHKIGKVIVALGGAAIGAAIGLSAGIGAITGGIIGGLGGYGIATFVGGGFPAVQSSLSSFGAGVGAVTGAIWGTFLAGIGTPILAFLVGFPLVVALILFIINSGAYMVPPGQELTSSTNPYISVEKTANPAGQVASPTSITYTVTIGAKKDTLTGITINAECQAIKKTGSIDCPPEKIPSPPTSINAGTPFSFTFTSDYGSQFQDSLVSNTVTVTAISASGGKVTETGSASVCFGKCPLDCFAFPDKYWPAGNSDAQKLKNLLTGAAGTIAGKYPNLAAKVCAKGTVNLCYNPGKLSPGIFGYHEHGGTCDIDFNTRVVPYGSEGTLYLLVHEVTHHIQKISGRYRQIFDDKVAPAEPSVCTYGGNDPDESMAEGSGLFVAKPVIYANAACVPNYQAKYPKHYDFAKNVLFAP